MPQTLQQECELFCYFCEQKKGRRVREGDFLSQLGLEDEMLLCVLVHVAAYWLAPRAMQTRVGDLDFG